MKHPAFNPWFWICVITLALVTLLSSGCAQTKEVPRESRGGFARASLPAVEPVRVITRLECQEMLTNKPPLRTIWIEQSGDMRAWTMIQGTLRTNDFSFVTNRFGTIRNYSWVVTNSESAMFFRAAGKGWGQ